ncbi:hypothetical protein AB7W88_06715 [Providencia vermicola]|uniref:hypothetical protein n=1 Tax=Providencia TaxID=586 RepID=UPI0012B60249|nr:MULTISPECIES: hypothetical protein [unclassified Providencia]MTB41333.1 hypothetical protein [Providencia sp. wls1949]MTC07059.1 hypothetical protein [Providencia sp. wls1948]
MPHFDKQLFVNHTENYFRQQNQTIPPEAQYNLSKGLTAYFLITSVKNKGNSYINLLSHAQNYLKSDGRSQSKTAISHELMTASIQKILDTQKPLDKIKRYQEYYSCSAKIEGKALTPEQSLIKHKRADASNPHNPFVQHQHFEKYNDRVHQLAYQYFVALKFKVLHNVNKLPPSLSHIFFEKLENSVVGNLAELVRKPNDALIQACLNIAAEQMRCPKLKQYDQSMKENGLNAESKTTLTYLFQISAPVDIENMLREDAQLAKTSRKETGIQIFIGEDTLAGYIRKDPKKDTPLFTLFDPNVGIKTFNNLDTFLNSLITKAKTYSHQHGLSIDTLKYKKFYHIRPSVNQPQSFNRHATAFEPSAPPFPFEPSAPPSELVMRESNASHTPAPLPSYDSLFSS